MCCRRFTLLGFQQRIRKCHTKTGLLPDPQDAHDRHQPRVSKLRVALLEFDWPMPLRSHAVSKYDSAMHFRDERLEQYNWGQKLPNMTSAKPQVLGIREKPFDDDRQAAHCATWRFTTGEIPIGTADRHWRIRNRLCSKRHPVGYLGSPQNPLQRVDLSGAAQRVPAGGSLDDEARPSAHPADSRRHLY
jgi:hypothetical protein